MVTLEEYAPSCPEGGEWYACGPKTKTRFVGCCDTDFDPCEVMCSDNNLRPGAFNAEYYADYVEPGEDPMPDATCGPSSSFYSCVFSKENDATF